MFGSVLLSRARAAFPEVAIVTRRPWGSLRACRTLISLLTLPATAALAVVGALVTARVALAEWHHWLVAAREVADLMGALALVAARAAFGSRLAELDALVAANSFFWLVSCRPLERFLTVGHGRMRPKKKPKIQIKM